MQTDTRVVNLELVYLCPAAVGSFEVYRRSGNCERGRGIELLTGESGK